MIDLRRGFWILSFCRLCFGRNEQVFLFCDFFHHIMLNSYIVVYVHRCCFVQIRFYGRQYFTNIIFTANFFFLLLFDNLTFFNKIYKLCWCSVKTAGFYKLTRFKSFKRVKNISEFTYFCCNFQVAWNNFWLHLMCAVLACIFFSSVCELLNCCAVLGQLVHWPKANRCDDL